MKWPRILALWLKQKLWNKKLLTLLLLAKKYDENDLRQCHANDALTSLIAENMLPLSIVESPSFRKYCHSLDPRFVVPSRKHLSTSLLTKKHEAIKSKLRDILAKAEGVSLTLDLWSNRVMKGFLGITCHFILNWSMYSLMLECKRFKGRHTAENIYTYYCEATTSHNIKGKVITTVTDNASNVVKAFSIPGYYGDCKSQDYDEDEEADEREMNAIDLHDSLDYVSQHDTCFAHTLQLVIKDGFKQIGAVSTILGKVATIVSYICWSQSATEILEGETRLQLKNSTRWNSELRSIKSILSVSEDKLRLLDTAHLTAHDKIILDDLIQILTPFQEATDLTLGANVT